MQTTESLMWSTQFSFATSLVLLAIKAMPLDLISKSSLEEQAYGLGRELFFSLALQVCYSYASRQTMAWRSQSG